MKDAVLLLAHGAPERLEDVESYLSFVRGGRPGSPKVLEEVRSRYAAIGGSSPLLGWTRAQAVRLRESLGIPVFIGMRNWNPFIRETIAEMQAAGVERVAAIALAPQYSEASVGLYIRRTQDAAREAGMTADFRWARGFHDEPLLVAAFAERLRAVWTGQPVLFTAHSLPEKALAGGDPYDAQSRSLAAAVAAAVGLPAHDFAYQSQGFTEDRWLGPTVESRLEHYGEAGVRELIIDPIGFVCDHVETLYDIEILFRAYAEEHGIELIRPEALNDSATFTAALAAVAKRLLGDPVA